MKDLKRALHGGDGEADAEFVMMSMSQNGPSVTVILCKWKDNRRR